MKTITDDSIINDKIIKAFRKVCDRKLFVKLSFATLN